FAWRGLIAPRRLSSGWMQCTAMQPRAARMTEQDRANYGRSYKRQAAAAAAPSTARSRAGGAGACAAAHYLGKAVAAHATGWRGGRRRRPRGPRLGVGLFAEEPGTDDDRALRLHAQPALPRHV